MVSAQFPSPLESKLPWPPSVREARQLQGITALYFSVLTHLCLFNGDHLFNYVFSGHCREQGLYLLYLVQLHYPQLKHKAWHKEGMWQVFVVDIIQRLQLPLQGRTLLYFCVTGVRICLPPGIIDHCQEPFPALSWPWSSLFPRMSNLHGFSHSDRKVVPKLGRVTAGSNTALGNKWCVHFLGSENRTLRRNKGLSKEEVSTSASQKCWPQMLDHKPGT